MNAGLRGSVESSSVRSGKGLRSSDDGTYPFPWDVCCTNELI